MSQGTENDVKDLIVSDAPFGQPEASQLVRTVAQDQARFRMVREAVQQLEARGEGSPHSRVRQGVCYYLLGRYLRAVEYLERESGGVAKYYLGKALAALDRHGEAIEAFAAAAKGGYNADDCTLARSGSLRDSGKPTEALAMLDRLSGAVEQTSEYLFQRASTVSAIGGNPQEVVALFERAVEADSGHSGALFGLAVENDRHGNDEEAIRLYERSLARAPAHLGTLLNLGVLYEDRNQFDRARQCYQRILESFPAHARATLYWKDAAAGGEMFMDEDAQRRRDRLGQILGIPVTDFELSVRSRNCLQKMGIMTLGDLAATTEQELLGSKNFGETSLVEIKDLLASKGLALGQLAQEKQRVEMVFEQQSLSPDEQAMLGRPIAELNLSVRARKCMIRLAIATVGELLRHTGDELLECKNFGVTSLNEVREKLTALGLKLRGD
jgi:DNA-directed RNA polymerase subunit alpha